MEKRDFYKLENGCEFKFREMGPFFHLCTCENGPILFHNDNEFKTAMNIVALLSFLNPEVEVITFEVMSNHMHFAVTGREGQIREWFDGLVKKMISHPELSGSRLPLQSLEYKLISISDLENARNVIAYINRNGYVVNPDETPFSYPWGANRFFFNPESEKRYETSGEKLSFAQRREMFRSNKGDCFKEFISLDGYISPLCFCKVNKGVALFRNARHYFSKITKNIESYSEIAKSIGESLFYNDDELYSLIAAICLKEYGNKSPKMVDAAAKMALARKLHYEYNSSNKQISRILGIDINAVSSFFPK